MDKTKKILELIFNEATSDGEIVNGVKFLRKKYKNGDLFTSKDLVENYEFKLRMCQRIIDDKSIRITQLENRLSSYATQIREKNNEVVEKIDIIENRDKTISSLEEKISDYKTWIRIFIFTITIFITMFIGMSLA